MHPMIMSNNPSHLVLGICSPKAYAARVPITKLRLKRG